MNLQELNLYGNQLISFADLKGMHNLKKLNVGKNKLITLAKFPALPALEHFDASENQITENGEKELDHLKDCAKLVNLQMAGNPWVDEKGEDFKKEVLIALDHLRIMQVNDAEEEVTEEERTDARAEKEEREKARREAEEEARLAAEEAAAEAARAAAEGEGAAGEAE